MIGIYKITSPSGKVYIGRSKNIHKRWTAYKRLDCKNQIRLIRSFIKYEINKHKFEILEQCEEKQLKEREYHFKILYNVHKIDSLCCVLKEEGVEMTPEIKAKISKAHLGKYVSIETRLKQSKARKGIPTGRQTVLGKKWKCKYNPLRVAPNKGAKLINGKYVSKKERDESKRLRMLGNTLAVGYKHSEKAIFNIIKNHALSKKIIQYSLQNVKIKEWRSAWDAETVLKISHGKIGLVCKQKRKTAGGFIWKYKN